MRTNALHPSGGAGFGGRVSGYAAARAGLHSFDFLTGAIRARQDSIGRSAVAAAAYPQPAFGHAQTAGSALAGAFAAYAATDAGRAKIEGLASAAGRFFGRLFGASGPEQLRLPFEE